MFLSELDRVANKIRKKRDISLIEMADRMDYSVLYLVAVFAGDERAENEFIEKMKDRFELSDYEVEELKETMSKGN